VSTERFARAFPALLLTTLAVLLVATSLGKRLSYDEPYHLAYGYRFLTEGPQVHLRERLPISALSALPCVARGCERADLDTSEMHRLLVRAPTMIFALACGLMLYLWAAALLGLPVARLTLVLYVFNPTILAHGKQVTTDMAMTCFMIAALFATWRFARRPTLASFSAAVLATAAAALSKHTSLMLLVLLPALALWAGALRDATTRRRALGMAAAGSATFVLAVLLSINTVYRFDGTFTPSGRVAWNSARMRDLATLNIPLPVPLAYAQGIDFASALTEQSEGISLNYVLGRRSHEGVWYAFPLMLFFKTPLALGVLLLLGLLRLGDARPSALRFWLLPALIYLAFFSLFVEAQIGIRYVLPTVVLLLPLAGAALHGNAGRRATLLLAGWYVVSSLSYLPHPMCYFNETIGRRLDAWRYLADSNLDWEDRRDEIERYRARHPERTIVVEPEQPQSGYLLVGVNRLLGLVGDDRYRWLRRAYEPVDHVGYSYLLFYVPANGDMLAPGPK
jgi:Dolichyl-phosphate-mannose-protein mannosyltransferase